MSRCVVQSLTESVSGYEFISIYVHSKNDIEENREIRALICICARLFEAFLMHTYIFMGTNKRKEKGASTIHYLSLSGAKLSL